MDINDLLQKSESSDIVVSEGDFYGLKLLYHPPRKNYQYSEYEFGNQEDMNTVASSITRENIFKCFYCGICSISEHNNVYSSHNSVLPLEYKSVENPASIINQEYFSRGINFFICGTIPPYFKKHLLFTTASHFSTYTVFENKDLFMGTFDILTQLSVQNPLLKFVFNGNAGSDLWHYHCHATDQEILYVDKHSTLESITKNLDSKIVKYLCLCDSNIEALFESANKIASIIYSDDFYSRKKYLSAVFKTVFYGGRPYFKIFFVKGTLTGPWSSEGSMLSYISPVAGMMSVSGKPPRDMEIAVKEFLSRNLYEDWTSIEPYRVNPSETKIELFEKLDGGRFNTPINEGYLQNLATRMEKCYAEEINRGGYHCDQYDISVYKYFLSFLFRSQIVALKGSIDSRIMQVYKNMMNQGFKTSIIMKLLKKITTIYSGKDSTIMPFYGGVTAKMLYSTLEGLFVSSSGMTLKTQTGNISNWVDTRTKKFIGEPSAMGAVMEFFLKNYNKTNIVIKLNKNPRVNSRDAFINEFRTGLALNNLRDNIPNFCLTLGNFECQTDSTISELCNVNGSYMDYIALEKITGETFKRIIQRNSPNIIANVFYQTLCALKYAQNKMEFVHYDLHADNILCVESPLPATFTYFIKEGEIMEKFTMPAEYCSVIIDYGSSHVRGLSKIPIVGKNRHLYGMTPEHFYPHRDVYSLCINTVFYLILFSRGNLLNQNGPLSSILIEILSRYVGTVLVGDFFQRVSSFVSNQGNSPVNRERLLTFFNGLRMDQKYFLYLPENHAPTPEMDLGYVLRKIRSIYPKEEGDWFWGDSDRIGSYKKSSSDKNKNELLNYISGYK